MTKGQDPGNFVMLEPQVKSNNLSSDKGEALGWHKGHAEQAGQTRSWDWELLTLV